MELPDFLPISYLNQLEYCPRRFWYMYVQGEMEVNAAVLEGALRHERVDTPGAGTGEQGQHVQRRLYVYSERLRIAGFCDLVEESGGRLTPVETKRGKLGKWLNDHVQLCAQALCLEERTGQPVTEGMIFYWRSRRRARVAITPELRAYTEATIQRAFDLLAAGQLPPPTPVRARCHDCSLEPICLPREVEMLERGNEGRAGKERMGWSRKRRESRATEDEEAGL